MKFNKTIDGIAEMFEREKSSRTNWVEKAAFAADCCTSNFKDHIAELNRNDYFKF